MHCSTLGHSNTRVLESDLTVSKMLVLTSSAGISTIAFLRKSIRSCLHLSVFSLNLLAFDQFTICSTVACKLLAPNFGTISETVVSPENFHMADRELSVVVMRSFIMTKKNLRPMRVPCGIPVGTGVNSEKQSDSKSEPSLTSWDLSRRKSASQLTTVGLTPSP